MQGIKTIALVSMGSCLEYHDFVVYGMLTKYLSAAFFPPSGGLGPVLQTLLTFALGYAARPLGALLAGTFGDIYGRKSVILYLTGGMAFSTLSIGLLPRYSTIGMWATAAIIMLRALQGLSFAAELTGAVTTAGEFSQKRGILTSVILSSTSIGAVSATLGLYGLTSLLSVEQIADWGFRIPFLVGGASSFLLWVFRRWLDESPEYLSAVAQNRVTRTYREFFKSIPSFKKQLLVGIGLSVFSSSLVIVNLYMPFFVNYCYDMKESYVYQASTVSLVASAILFPIFGFAADRVSKQKLMIVICCAYLVFNVPVFSLLQKNIRWLTMVFMLAHQLTIAIYLVCYFPTLFNLFPTSHRYTGMAVCYNVVYAGVSLLPWLITRLLDSGASHLVLPYILTLTCSLSLVAVLFTYVITPSENHNNLVSPIGLEDDEDATKEKTGEMKGLNAA